MFMEKSSTKQEHKISVSLVGQLVVALLILNPLVAFADDPPSITSFTFSFATQEISFSADLNGKPSINFSIASSSAQTTFSGPQAGNCGGAVSCGNSWGITPGGAAVGEIHTFTVTVSNANGTDVRTKCLKVVAGGGVRGTSYEEDPKCPTISAWGSAALAGLVLAAGAIVVARRQKVLAT